MWSWYVSFGILFSELVVLMGVLFVEDIRNGFKSGCFDVLDFLVMVNFMNGVFVGMIMVFNEGVNVDEIVDLIVELVLCVFGIFVKEVV